MGKLKLYGSDASPPVRSVLLTLKALNLSFVYEDVYFAYKEDLKEYIKEHSPVQTVPTLDDDGHKIYESHAINIYLVEKYGKSDDLYPKDLLKRAKVDQCLYCEPGAIYIGALPCIMQPIFMRHTISVDEYKIDDVIDIYKTIEIFLKDQPYVAGDKLTIADFSFITSVTTLEAFIPLDPLKYEKMTAWIKRIKKLPYYAYACEIGIDQVVNMIRLKNLKIC